VPERADVVIVGGGIVGLATALALTDSRLRVVVLEAESRLAAHQTGHNSGVIHSGLYYKPGSLKARLCVAGRTALYRLCAEEGIAHERCGKLVVAVSRDELPRLDELERRGAANGLGGMRRLAAADIAALEPAAAGVAALWVEETGIVDFSAVAAACARRIEARGGEVRRACRFTGLRRGSALEIGTDAGNIAARHLVNCAGLESDRVARRCGVDPKVRIVPFRGEYFTLRPERRSLVRNLIYPVPDPQFPFLGVHLTRRIDGDVEAGPNAVLALRRGGYGRWRWSARDTASTMLYGGFWRLARRFWRTGAGELRRSGSRRLFARDLRRLVPAIAAGDLLAGGCGVRAQAVDPAGNLVDDFVIVDAPGQTHVVNAPSPAATASLAIGETIAERVRRDLG
jgi:(S)-2-hydroxyglutarate dehydrogenase